jgi:thymidine phosphorylase
MNTPLGRSAGNWLEVKESVACLEGTGPEDLRELVLTAAAHLLVQTGKAESTEIGFKEAEDCLASGAPRRKWDEMLLAQGADIDLFEQKLASKTGTSVVIELQAEAHAFVSRCDASVIGEVVRDLGAGRQTKESRINHDVGVDRLAKPGEVVKRGGILARIHAGDPARAELARTRLKAAFDFSAQRVQAAPLVCEVLK